MAHFDKSDILGSLDTNGRVTVLLDDRRDTAWNPEQDGADLQGPCWIDYQLFPDDTWTAKANHRNTTSTYYRSDR